MSNYDTTVFIENGEVQQLAEEKKIDSIQIDHYINFDICRVKVITTNRSVFQVKLSKRKMSDPTKEKLFKSFEGVCKWAKKLIETSLREGNATQFTYTLYSSEQIVIDDIFYSKNNPFDWNEHHSKKHTS